MPNNPNDLLIELGVEELPSKCLKSLCDNFIEVMVKGLDSAQLAFKEVKGFVTPRRLAVLISHVDASQPQQITLKKGPAQSAGLDKEGRPTGALLGFAKSCGVDVSSLSVQETDKGSFYSYEKKEPGKKTPELIPHILETAIQNLNLPKRMRWGNNSESFVRPMHWLLVLFGNAVIDTEVFGIQSEHFTHGHRFHHPQKIAILVSKDYENTLIKTGKVWPDFEKRKQHILNEMNIQALKHQGNVVFDEDLLEEVTGLVEWPIILIGKFDKEFLKLPKEVLISSMKLHQKCFPIEDNNRQLLPYFIIISNIESTNPDVVIEGNESVIHARLSDAAFFYHQDIKQPLEKYREGLKNVVFQHGLGSLWDKSQRISKLADFIIKSMNHLNHDQKAHLANSVFKAGLICKADLLTQMVGEFPELQGIIGHYYALQEGTKEPIARAIEEHYHPRFAEDSLPETLEGAALAIADRADSLVGIFGLGKKPSGEKDPFGLRRQALGMLRIIIENKLETIDIETLFTQTKLQYENLLSVDVPIMAPLLDFCFERLRAWYHEKGIPARVFEAVLAKWPTKPYDFHCRLQAVTEFQQLKETESLSAANKRVKNILSKSDAPALANDHFDESLLVEPAEKNLAKILLQKQKEIKPYLEQAQYTEALKTLAALKEPIDHFFDTVMVMVEDEKLRQNRIKLLNQLRNLFLEIADISLL